MKTIKIIHLLFTLFIFPVELTAEQQLNMYDMTEQTSKFHEKYANGKAEASIEVISSPSDKFITAAAIYTELKNMRGNFQGKAKNRFSFVGKDGVLRMSGTTVDEIQDVQEKERFIQEKKFNDANFKCLNELASLMRNIRNMMIKIVDSTEGHQGKIYKRLYDAVK